MEEQVCFMSSMLYVLGLRPLRLIFFSRSVFFPPPLVRYLGSTPRVTGVVKGRWRETRLLDRLFTKSLRRSASKGSDLYLYMGEIQCN